MAITFHCPTGHKLSCRDELAGRPGKCPKCSAPFTVPDRVYDGEDSTVASNPFDFAQLEFPGSEAAAGKGQLAAANATKVATPAATPTSAPDPMALSPAAGSAGPITVRTENSARQGNVEFLCPNGHRLAGSLSLVGRPGQCPHCGMRFIVPSPEEETPETEESVTGTGGIPIQIDTTASGSNLRPGSRPSHAAPAGLGPAGLTSAVPASPAPATQVGPPVASLAQAPAATLTAPQLFGRLWQYKLEQGASVELHLADGKLLAPERFAPQLSSGTHAVFSEKEANGSHRVTAVAWASIHKIAIRGVAKLPPGVFEPA